MIDTNTLALIIAVIAALFSVGSLMFVALKLTESNKSKEMKRYLAKSAEESKGWGDV